MTPEERKEFDDLKQLVRAIERVEHVPFIENIKRRTIGAAITDALSTLKLDDLQNVTITSPSNGQVLKFNGTVWVDGTDNVA